MVSPNALVESSSRGSGRAGLWWGGNKGGGGGHSLEKGLQHGEGHVSLLGLHGTEAVRETLLTQATVPACPRT